MMNRKDQIRRRLVLTSLALPLLPLLPGCAAPMAKRSNPASEDSARALLLESAAAHGMAAFKDINDISIRYEGHWRPVVGRLQPALVDAGFRGESEERLLPALGMVAQAHTGASGSKHVTRNTRVGSPGDVQVWFNGEEAQDADRRAAAALVVDGYSLFLLGPLLLAERSAAGQSLNVEMAGTEKLVLDGQKHECDVLRVTLRPGLGFSDSDELAVYIDRGERLMRCVRFTLDGLESTRGAIAEVQTFDHVKLHGVSWPTRFYERLIRPLPLPVHNWRMAGLDVNRGLLPGELSGAQFSGKATAAATRLADAQKYRSQ